MHNYIRLIFHRKGCKTITRKMCSFIVFTDWSLWTSLEKTRYDQSHRPPHPCSWSSLASEDSDLMRCRLISGLAAWNRQGTTKAVVFLPKSHDFHRQRPLYQPWPSNPSRYWSPTAFSRFFTLLLPSNAKTDWQVSPHPEIAKAHYWRE